MQRILDNARIKNKVIGAILAIQCRNHSTIYTSGLSTQSNYVTHNMHYRIGGQGLTTMATMLLILVDKGLTTLNTTIGTYINDIPNGNKITLYQLSNMTSGLPDYTEIPSFNKKITQDVFADVTIDEILSLIKTLTPLYEPGKDWNYGHLTNYFLLGIAMEIITGKSFNVLFTELIAKPLQLHNTKSTCSLYIQEPVMHSYQYTSQKSDLSDATFWNSSWGGYITRINSDPNDMLILTKAINTGKLISESSYNSLFRNTTVGLSINTNNRYYGMGIMVGGYGNPSINWINARFNGYRRIPLILQIQISLFTYNSILLEKTLI